MKWRAEVRNGIGTTGPGDAGADRSRDMAPSVSNDARRGAALTNFGSHPAAPLVLLSHRFPVQTAGSPSPPTP